MEWISWMRNIVPALWSPAVMRIIVLIVIDLCSLFLRVISWFLNFLFSLLWFLNELLKICELWIKWLVRSFMMTVVVSIEVVWPISVSMLPAMILVSLMVLLMIFNWFTLFWCPVNA